MDPISEIGDDFYGDEEAYSYRNLIRGRYLGALLRRSEQIEGGSAKGRKGKGKGKGKETSATTLSDSTRAAFKDAQEAIVWHKGAAVGGNVEVDDDIDIIPPQEEKAKDEPKDEPKAMTVSDDDIVVKDEVVIDDDIVVVADLPASIEEDVA